MKKPLLTWICCQIGAREHYSIPRVLRSQEKLECLITDAWISHNSSLNLLPKYCLTNLRERYHPELKNTAIKSFTSASITWEILQKFKNRQDWDKIIARNIWWQQQALKQIKKANNSSKNITLFAYSYAALELFEYAKSQQWKTVLGQIDPGIIEEKLVLQEAKKYPQYQSNIKSAPLQYWQSWRQECALADEIIVNSLWSKNALEKTGILSNKIKVIPLAYQASTAANSFERTYPDNFSSQRPLKILFLGQVILRKGIAAIFDALKLLNNKPVEFWFIGRVGIDLPQSLKKHPKIKWVGAVSRSNTAYYYQQADVFLFPTLSDGFGLTQLEAQAWKLPLITSEFCGAVVKDGINGLILPSVTGKAIASSLIFCLNNPQKLAECSKTSHQILSDFNLSKLAQKLHFLDSTDSIKQPPVYY